MNTGIRVVKYYAWERPFIKVVDKARDNELIHLRGFLFWKVLAISLSSLRYHVTHHYYLLLILGG
jgi:hypothetical protein